MKKVMSLILLVVMIAMLAVPAAADYSDPCDAYVRLISVTDGVKLDWVVHELSEEDMFAAVKASEGIIPADASFQYLTLLCKKTITSNEEDIDLALRIWGSRNRLALLFFQGVDEEDWTLIDINKGK